MITCKPLPDVYVIGEFASWKENYYGLIAPGSEFFSLRNRIRADVDDNH
jgi:hypothetical protein